MPSLSKDRAHDLYVLLGALNDATSKLLVCEAALKRAYVLVREILEKEVNDGGTPLETTATEPP